MPNYLSVILETKKKRIEILKKNRQGILSLVKKARTPRSFKKAIKREGKISLIAELKQASPSAGILRKELFLEDMAKAFVETKVNAVSILTEEDFFLGKVSYINEVSNMLDIPILRKDFIIDEIQIFESKAASADAILLLPRILSNEKLVEFCKLAQNLGLDVLVEVHTEKELRRILSLPIDIIGINNRNLDTFKVDLNITAKLVPFISKDKITVSESGISTLKDVLWLKGLGVNAILVGEAIMRSESIKEKIKELHIDG